VTAVEPEAVTRDVVFKLATALERLGARITRDLDTEASESSPPDDERWGATIDGVVQYAEECLRILDEPMVVDVLSGANR
jgi:hypothetical protein